MTRLVHWCVTTIAVVTLTCLLATKSIQAPTEDVDQVVSQPKVREKRDMYLDKVTTCVRQAGLSLTQRDVKCVIGKMYYILELKTEASCKNCFSFFYCKANSVATALCTGSDVISTMDAITSCVGLRNSDDEADGVIEASTCGRSSECDCDTMYLCSRGCRYASSNSTCTATCR